MNPIQKALTALNPPVSPIPDDIGTKAVQLALQKIKGIPQDFIGSLQSATNISPPIDLIHKLTVGSAYGRFGPTGSLHGQNATEAMGAVPYSEQVNQNMQNIKDAINATKLIGYMSALRPFRSNPLNMNNAERAVKEAGKWIIQDNGSGYSR